MYIQLSLNHESAAVGLSFTQRYLKVSDWFKLNQDIIQL